MEQALWWMQMINLYGVESTRNSYLHKLSWSTCNYFIFFCLYYSILSLKLNLFWLDNCLDNIILSKSLSLTNSYLHLRLLLLMKNYQGLLLLTMQAIEVCEKKDVFFVTEWCMINIFLAHCGNVKPCEHDFSPNSKG